MGGDVRNCVLRYRIGDRAHRVIIDDRQVVLGRGTDCDLVIPGHDVSRRHAEIARRGGRWIVADLGSTNGVTLNGARVRRKTLKNGDRIDLGSVRIDVVISPEDPPVVFRDGGPKSLDTSVIDMDEFDAALSGGAGMTPVPTGPSAAGSDGGPHDPAWAAGLFSQAAEFLLASESVDEMLERILALVFDHLPAERGVICLRDETSGRTTPAATRTRRGAPQEPIHISRHIVDTAVSRKQSVLVRDSAKDERFRMVESIVMMNIHSAMCAPLYRGGRVGGFVYVDSRGCGAPFDEQQLQILSALAILAAVAVEQGSLRERIRLEQEIRGHLSRYCSAAVVERMLRGDGEARMGAEEGEVTVLFADLAGFTAIAERLPPVEVIEMLNEVLGRLTDAVFEFEGTLDKFRGDGMMAFFGAPLAQADHAERAIRAALRMQQYLGQLNLANPDRQPIAIRIGINSGAVVMGDVGGPQRRDYTVIGDTVNTASRLESSVARPGQIVVGAATYEEAHSKFVFNPLKEVRLKGKQRLVRPYLVLRSLRASEKDPSGE